MKTRYFVTRCVRCGEMPYYLIFYHDIRQHPGQFVMLCTFAKLRQLLSSRHGFSDPQQYGKVIYKNREGQPTEMLAELLKSRYDFDLNEMGIHEVRFL
ncbi:MAG: hypothetical protein SFT92_01850 [Rickettsiales bacterium]|nr:hypothetical protein [Rickettsiales bacterium]